MAEWSGPQHCSLSAPVDLGETAHPVKPACLSVKCSDATYFKGDFGANKNVHKRCGTNRDSLLLLILLF